MELIKKYINNRMEKLRNVDTKGSKERDKAITIALIELQQVLEEIDKIEQNDFK